MKSAIARTEEIGMREAADELMKQIREQIELGENSVGLLYYDYEMDGDELSGYLHEDLGIDVLGCSTIATLDNKTGYTDMSAMFMVLTGDDCGFTVGITDTLTNETAKDKINQTFSETRSRAGGDPKLGFVLFPCGTDIVFDKRIEDLSEMCDNLPIIGGIPSSTNTAEKSVAFNGAFYLNMAAILLFTGNVDPIISLSNVISTFNDRKDLITKTEGTAICEVDGMPFVDYLESYGIDAKYAARNNDQIFFQKYPLLIENEASGFSHEVPYVRVLDHIDWESKSGIAYAGVPEGAMISLAILRREDIIATVEKGVKELLQKIEDSGREYRTIICITCAARHVTLNPHYDDEGIAVRRLLEGTPYSLGGFYSYGELCPIAYEDGKANNQLHNGSIVFCAL